MDIIHGYILHNTRGDLPQCFHGLKASLGLVFRGNFGLMKGYHLRPAFGQAFLQQMRNACSDNTPMRLCIESEPEAFELHRQSGVAGIVSREAHSCESRGVPCQVIGHWASQNSAVKDGTDAFKVGFQWGRVKSAQDCIDLITEQLGNCEKLGTVDQPLKDRVSMRVFFILQQPANRYRCIEHPDHCLYPLSSLNTSRLLLCPTFPARTSLMD